MYESLQVTVSVYMTYELQQYVTGIVK